MIGVIDYGINNISSVTSFLNRQGLTFARVRDTKNLMNCEKLILPGVGAFKKGMENLEELKLPQSIVRFASSGRPILGICLGMQLLFDSSEENGFSQGLGIIRGKVERINNGARARVHMGWNNLILARKSRILDEDLAKLDVYFAHSYHCVPIDSTLIVAHCEFDGSIVAAIEHDNIFGLQFHPEKSQISGIKILENFAKLK